MHIIQKELIKRLIRTPNIRFSELTRGYTADDNVVFHLKELVKFGYIKKENDIYEITSLGVKKTQVFDLGNMTELGCKPLITGFIVKVGDKFVIKKHDHAITPFYNLPSGKPYHDKGLRSELVRILKEEIGKEVSKKSFQFDSLHMKDIVTNNGDILFCDTFVVYTVEIEKIGNIPENMNLLSIEEIEKLNNRWKEIDYCILKKNWRPYLEYTMISDYIL